MEIITTSSIDEKVKVAKKLLLSVGNKIGSVYFTKKDGKLRRMCYRLHVYEPQYSKAPKGNDRRDINDRNNLLVVFDTNKVLYNDKGKMRGRGAWRSLSLERVKRICVNGKIYKFA